MEEKVNIRKNTFTGRSNKAKDCFTKSKQYQLIKQDVLVEHYCPRNGHFLRNVTLIFDLDLDDMTLTSWVLWKATCIPNMSIVT